MALVLFVVLVVAGSLANGFALSKLWLWFVAETFNIKPLTIPQALGIGLIFFLMVDSPKSEEKDSTTKLIDSLGTLFIRPLATLILGWIYYQFV